MTPQKEVGGEEMTEEPKMENYNEIIEFVKNLRRQEIEIQLMQKTMNRFHEKLEEFGLRCNNITNCVDVAKKCYKCKNNYSRRSYFRDLLQKDVDVQVFGADATCFNSVESGSE